MIIRSKANTLIDLRFKLKKAKIPYLKIYQVKKFLKNNKEIINDIKLNFKSKIVIRSSSKQEDTKKKIKCWKISKLSKC